MKYFGLEGGMRDSNEEDQEEDIVSGIFSAKAHLSASVTPTCFFSLSGI